LEIKRRIPILSKYEKTEDIQFLSKLEIKRRIPITRKKVRYSAFSGHPVVVAMRGRARFCATAHYGNDRALRVCSVVADMRGHAGEVRYRAYSGRPIVVAMRDHARFCASA